MTWQRSEGDGADRRPDDETRADWGGPGPDPGVGPAPVPPPPPAGPPGAPIPGQTIAQPTAYEPPRGYGATGGYPAPGGAWAPPPDPGAGYGVPGAPAIRFAGTLPRVLAWWLDAIIVGIGAGIVAGITGGFAGAATGDATMAAAVTTVVFMGLQLLYFVGFWTGTGRATPGMRLFNLQVGNAADGRTLTRNQAVIRWAALGLPLQALALLPPPISSIGAIAALWELVLLVTTILSPTKQGLHDRWAGSAIVQPVGREGPVVACLILAVLLLVILPIFSIVMLIVVGAQVSTILSTVGTSI